MDLLFHTVYKIRKKKNNDPDRKPYFQVHTFTWPTISEIQPLPCFYFRFSELLCSLGEMIGGKKTVLQDKVVISTVHQFSVFGVPGRIVCPGPHVVGWNCAPLLRNLIAGSRPSDLFSLWQGI